ncbi:MAG: SDR family NAD(P)-dependent oxidoreductase, partial [Chloroflexi bacterium]
MRFKDRVALVTGGGRGIGAATAKLLASEGARVAVSDLDETPAREVADPIGALAVACDISVRADVNHMVELVEKKLGGV